MTDTVVTDATMTDSLPLTAAAQPIQPYQPPGADPRSWLLRLTLLAQALLATITAIESLILGTAGFGNPVPGLLTAVLAVVLGLAARAVGRRGAGGLTWRRLRLLRALQWCFFVAAVLDVAVAALLDVAPPPLPFLVRVGLAATVLGLTPRTRRRTRPGSPRAGTDAVHDRLPVGVA